ncbi:hypothetical protein P0D88_47430 [Paraburkholderia sp. RL18-103-BIB-C]|uniref:hypothetical protein n=1 Tax=unclassified Paraburkholderia TaxID=2615204 RepID=UPI0038B80974
MTFQREVRKHLRTPEEIETERLESVLHLQVDWHETGRFTLKEGRPGRWSDCLDTMALVANDDKGEFYRAVAIRLARLATQGVPFVFNDVTYDR